DSADVYNAISKLYRVKGKISTSLNYFEKYLDLIEKIYPPLRVLVQQAFTIGYYIEAGKEKQAFEILKNIESKFEPPLDKVAAFGYLFAYLELEDADNAEKQIPDAEQLAKGFGEEMLLANVYHAWGRIYEMREEYEKAIENYLIFHELQPTSFALNIYLCQCYRELGENKKAEEYILEALKYYPFRPKINYEAALIYMNMGDNEKAIEYLRRANAIWKEADHNYEPAQEAKEKLIELEAI
ncbi:MAG: hypothetical protein K8R68_03975, partial [Bacteroidales bacterium]|nr:hypothetical protein [Bacteroidales bacterium]